VSPREPGSPDRVVFCAGWGGEPGSPDRAVFAWGSRTRACEGRRAKGESKKMIERAPRDTEMSSHQDMGSGNEG